jgi:7-cyano-7-deazaguanine synthase in queuosine biosynthesis
MNIVLCFTPGIDSFLTNYFINQYNLVKNEDNFFKVYFDFHTRYSKYEINFLKKLYGNSVDIFDAVNLSNFEKDNAHVPNRNLIIATLAQSIYNADKIIFSGCADDRVSDNTDSFYSSCSDVLTKTAEKKVSVKSLLINYEKSENVNYYKFLKFDCNEKLPNFKIIENTFSCFNNILYTKNINLKYYIANSVCEKEIHYTGCLECNACFRKNCALTAMNFYLPFNNIDLVKKYLNDSDIVNNFPSRYHTIENYYKFLTENKTSLYNFESKERLKINDYFSFLRI